MPGSTVDHVRHALRTRASELYQATVPFGWRIPGVEPRDPVHSPIDPAWELYDPKRHPLREKQKNWAYAEIAFPETLAGVPLAGTRAQITILNGIPFTMWVDGVEAFKEDHIWMALGPILDGFEVSIQPGKRYRIVFCAEPTQIEESGYCCFRCGFRFDRLHEFAVDLDAMQFQLGIAANLARTPRERTMVEKAARIVDVAALEHGDIAGCLASASAMERILMPLSLRAKALTVHCVGHSHLDMDYRWTWPDTVKCVRRDFKAVTDLMADHPEVTFSHSQIPTYQIAEELDPAIFAAMKHRIAEGRWENTAGTWVEGDPQLADGESIARHMLYAKQWTHAKLASEATVLWEPDTFTNPGNLPQLAKLGGFEAIFHGRGLTTETLPLLPFHVWQGIDGTRLPAAVDIGLGGFDPWRVDALLWDKEHAKLRRHGLLVWGIGDHGGALPRAELKTLARYRDRPLVPTFRFTSMRKAIAAAAGTKLPIHVGELQHEFEGCFTTHAEIKRWNRRCETALLAAETLTVMAKLDRRDALREAWLPMLFNQFHDIICGASIHEAYDNAYARGEASLQRAQAIAVEAVDELCDEKTDSRSLTIINTLAFMRTEPVRCRLPEGATGLVDDQGRTIPIQRHGDDHLFIAEALPACGRRTYSVAWKAPRNIDLPTAQDQGNPLDQWLIDTTWARIRIAKRNGVIGGLFDKRLERELVAFGAPRRHTDYTGTPICRADLAMHVFQVIDESPNPMSAWMIHDIRREENLLRDAIVHPPEIGPVFIRIAVTHSFRQSRITEDILIYHAFPRIDFETTIDWRERGDEQRGVPQLKVSFGSGITHAALRTEGPFSIERRTADGMEYPTQKWFDVTGDEAGFTVYNDSRHGCDALGGRGRLTLLRNGYHPDRDSDQGVHVVRFALEPHGPAVSHRTLVEKGMSYNRPPVMVAAHAIRPFPPLKITGKHTVVGTALRLAEHSDGILLRLFETSGKPCRARIALGKITTVREVDFLERPLKGRSRMQGGAVVADFRAFEVKTLLVQLSR